MRFNKETVTILRDRYNYIRAIIYYDTTWYALAPLGDSRKSPTEFMTHLKSAAKRWAKETCAKAFEEGR